MKRIFIVGNYGAHNLGDDVMLRVMLHFLNGKYETSVFCIGKAEGESCGATFVPFFHIRGLIQVLYRSDVIIFGGGAIVKNVSLIKLLPILFISRLLKKKIVFFGVEVYRLHPLLRGVFHRVACRAVDFTVRNEISKSNIVPIKAEMHPDIAYGLPLIIKMPEANRNPHRIVGVSVRPSLLADRFNEKEARRRVLHILSSEQADEFWFFSFQPCDRKEIEKVAGQLTSGVKVRIVDCSRIEETMEDMSRLSRAVGMRFHFLVFASMLNIPFETIPYTQKVIEFERCYKCVPTNELSSQVMQAFQELVNRIG